MVVLRPGAVAYRYGRKPNRDRREMAEKRDVKGADLCFPTEAIAECSPGFYEERFLVQLHIGCKPQPAKQKQAQNCACYADRISFQLFQLIFCDPAGALSNRGSSRIDLDTSQIVGETFQQRRVDLDLLLCLRPVPLFYGLSDAR